jgi:hypothetical protein
MDEVLWLVFIDVARVGNDDCCGRVLNDARTCLSVAAVSVVG